ncbi:MAG: uracil-DNA glycosylase [SAR324 cluster bacterium]|nr:uracil-DNA glycosylase [SAR324 cluster bacterium]
METDTLIRHLENQLLWLDQQNYTYLNLEKLFDETYFNQPLSAAEQSPTNKEEQLPEDTIESLYAQNADCERCPLSETRTNFVFGTGNVSTPLLFIGEGPGADEDRLGEPFVGKAGRLLTQMIQSIGIDRPDVYIANVVKCRPPKNRTPHAEEIAKCFPILHRQIELINPALIVTLGNVPTRALIPDASGITKSRGQIYHYQNWKVLPTFHPAYLLRNPAAMTSSWDDFKKIMTLCFDAES